MHSLRPVGLSRFSGLNSYGIGLDGAEEPEVEQGKQQAAYGELEPSRGMRRGEEALEAAGHDEHGNDSGDEPSGFNAALSYGFLPTQCSGEEHGVAKAEPAAPAMTIAGSSSEPWGATKLHNATDIPY